MASMNLPIFTAYVHDLSPFLWHIKGDFGVRWYGFMYVLGFIGAFLLVRWFVRLKCCELKEERVADFITAVALFGVMLGGRLGYMIFYNWTEFSENPKIFFYFLHGGMASHGAIFGIILVVFLFARWQKISWLGLGDNLVIAGPLGFFFGRLGNFINGELYGRKTEHVWAMKFPAEIRGMSFSDVRAFIESAKEFAPNLYAKAGEMSHSALCDSIIDLARKNEAFEKMLADSLLNPRHPSQIYQSLCEGLIVFLILLAVRLKWKNAWHGLISGLFFILYAIARIAVENLREPDSSLILGITKGQFYSYIMIAIGVSFIAWAIIRKRQNETL